IEDRCKLCWMLHGTSTSRGIGVVAIRWYCRALRVDDIVEEPTCRCFLDQQEIITTSRTAIEICTGCRTDNGHHAWLNRYATRNFTRWPLVTVCHIGLDIVEILPPIDRVVQIDLKGRYPCLQCLL